MTKSRNARLAFALLLVVMLMATTTSAVFAGKPGPSEGNARLTVLHRINGAELGLPMELPVDVCINGAYAFSFEYMDKVETEIPAGEYTFQVFLASDDKCAGEPVLSAGPASIPAGSMVLAKAYLKNGAPDLKVKIIEKMPK